MTKPIAWLTPFFENNRDGKLVPIIVSVESAATPDDGWKPLYASPQPTNPAQVTEAMKTLRAELVEALDGHTKYSRDCSLSGEFLASQIWSLVSAAIGASGQADGREWCKLYHSRWPTEDLLKAREPGGLITDDGEAWKYHYTHSDAQGGTYDLVYRPIAALSQPHPADEGVVEALPRPDAVSMTCGTICLEYADKDERDLAFDWLEAHGAGDAKESR